MKERGWSLGDVARQGRYLVFDAEEAATRIMRAGKPDLASIAGMAATLESARKASAAGPRSHLTIVGEISVVLCRRGNPEAALEGRSEPGRPDSFTPDPHHVHVCSELLRSRRSARVRFRYLSSSLGYQPRSLGLDDHDRSAAAGRRRGTFTALSVDSACARMPQAIGIPRNRGHRRILALISGRTDNLRTTARIRRSRSRRSLIPA